MMNNIPHTQWAAIPENSDYIVSSCGIVASLKWNKFRILKQAVKSDGYKIVCIYTNSREKKIKTVHRLVARSFIGESCLQVNHLDGNKENNSLSNLEYCTASENIKHAYKLGLNRPGDFKGEKNNRAKLKESDVLKIRRDGKKYTNYFLAKKYNVDQAAINRIINYKAWKHVKGVCSESIGSQ